MASVSALRGVRVLALKFLARVFLGWIVVTVMDKRDPKQNSQLGNRNPVVVVARARNSAGHMRDRRNRRAKDARKHWSKEQW